MRRQAAEYPHPASPAVTAAMKGNRRSDTTPETKIRSLLHRAGYRFRKDYRITLCHRSARPDIAFTAKQVAIFIDGCFWHSCPIHGRTPAGPNTQYWQAKLAANTKRDHQNNHDLQEAGWTVMRIWEHQEPRDAVLAIISTLHANPGRKPPRGTHQLI